ncbi:hypothetical protein M3Y95_00650000 [Aphelenchoides besseyi]|nr:hypothetical protein M3Y95_00650000 [Aphelenchoides besseyi]
MFGKFLVIILFLIKLKELKAQSQDDNHWFWYEPYYNSIFRYIPWLEKVFGYPFGYNWWCAPYFGKAYGNCPQYYGFPNYPNVWKFGYGKGKFCSFCLSWAAVKCEKKDAYEKCKDLCDKRSKKQRNEVDHRKSKGLVTSECKLDS